MVPQYVVEFMWLEWNEDVIINKLHFLQFHFYAAHHPLFESLENECFFHLNIKKLIYFNESR